MFLVDSGSLCAAHFCERIEATNSLKLNQPTYFSDSRRQGMRERLIGVSIHMAFAQRLYGKDDAKVRMTVLRGRRRRRDCFSATNNMMMEVSFSLGS